MFKQILILIVAIAFFCACQNSDPENSEEIQNLKQLLKENPESIAALNGKLTKEEGELAAELINAHLNDYLKKEFETQWQNEILELEDIQMKFKYKKFGEMPPDGWSLYISMHGGGGAPARVNDQQWENQKKLYEPEEGLYMAPRAPTDSWNLWHQEHIDVFFARFIQLADAFENINTNRVYLTGYSAGGDGTYQLAPRMADCFAAAAMMAGHPNDASPLGLRNLPFAIQMGAQDGAYDRNKIAVQWGEKLDELQKNDPNAYKHKVDVYEGLGHWMERKDTAAVEWMGNFDRMAYPGKVVWKQSSVTHERFYWLAVPKERAQKDALLIASIDGQTITIEKAELVDEVIVRLNDVMLDLNEKVKVIYDGKIVYEKIPQRAVSTIWQSLNERNDLEQVFSSQIQISLN